jgi:alkanesulfonate monooxygenase SsuD/methylene tetrahydromethanopterin reductase-like flavin-dependent oxidoreductase (luciferase family)
MVELSISVEGVIGLTWPQWQYLVSTVEPLGFEGMYLSDHIVLWWNGFDQPSLDMIVGLTYLADHTQRVRFGPMVSPLSFRDPVMLARQAAAIDDLSGGRMILGLGTGHFVREHAIFGYNLGDMQTRFARLEEGLEVITRLLRSDSPVSFDGEFYHLQDAVLPPPQIPGRPPIMVGGSGPKRTLPLVARYADVWNALDLTPEAVVERSTLLDSLLEAEGRHPGDVRRTITLPVFCSRTPAELETRVQWARRFPPWRDLSAQEILDDLSWKGLIGTPEDVISQILAYEAAGINEIVMQWFGSDDIEGLEMLASEVLPHV